MKWKEVHDRVCVCVCTKEASVSSKRLESLDWQDTLPKEATSLFLSSESAFVRALFEQEPAVPTAAARYGYTLHVHT